MKAYSVLRRTLTSTLSGDVLPGLPPSNAKHESKAQTTAQLLIAPSPTTPPLTPLNYWYQIPYKSSQFKQKNTIAPKTIVPNAFQVTQVYRALDISR
jgi:hypothetical protein